MCACIDEGSWQAGKAETSTQTLEVCYQQLVMADNDRWLTNGRIGISNGQESVTVLIRLEVPGGSTIPHVCYGSTRSQMGGVENSGS